MIAKYIGKTNSSFTQGNMYNISLYKERITDSFNNKSTVIKLKSDNVECEDMVYKVVGRLFADWDI